MDRAVSEQVNLTPSNITLGKRDRGRCQVERRDSKICLYKFVLPTIFGHFHQGYEYENSSARRGGNPPPCSEWEESRFRAVKSFMIDKYNARGRSGEDPDSEIRIKAHVEARSSIDIAFDNHVILPGKIMSNANQKHLRRKDERYYFAMYPLARGGDIFEALHDAFSTEEECKLVFRQVFQGVKYLHSLGIYHNDLKPENIVTDTERNRAHIIDFGQAIIVENINGQRITKTGSGYGTSLYSAPEFSIESRDTMFDWRKADVWALGVSLYIILLKDYPVWTQGGRLIPVDPSNGRFQSLFGPNGNFPAFCRRREIGLTENAIDLLYRMLCGDVENRISIDEILSHPWLNS